MTATVIAEDAMGSTVIGQVIEILGFVVVDSVLNVVYAEEGTLRMAPAWVVRLEEA